MLDVHQLSVFRAVAQNLSFTRAAQSLDLTQSAVSHQIAALERLLGTGLFIRQGRQVTLTPAGAVLLSHSRRIFALIEETQQAVRFAARPDQGRLRIGASPTACQYLMPPSLREFRESYPAYALMIQPADSPQVAEMLLENRIDLGVLIRSDRLKQLTYQPLFTDELGFLVSPTHPWAGVRKIDRAQIAEQHYVLYSRHSATYKMLERYFLKIHAPLRHWTELGSMEAIKELVKLGLGVSLMARWTAQEEIEQGSLVWIRLPGARLKRTWCIASRVGRRLSLAEQTFVGFCQAAAGALQTPEE